MLVAVKLLREIKCFKFLFKSCGAGFVANVGRESVPCGRSRERERSLAELGSETWSEMSSGMSSIIPYRTCSGRCLSQLIYQLLRLW